MQPIKKLAGHSLGYFVGNIIIMFAGVISFPIWTRVLSIVEYGVFSTISITINFLTGFLKFGCQEAGLRFYHEFQGTIEKRYLYYSTLILGPLLIGILITGFLISIIILYGIGDEQWRFLLILAIVLGLAGAIGSIFSIFYRADQRVIAYNTIAIIQRYIGLITSYMFVIIFSLGLSGLFIGNLLTQTLIIITLVCLLMKVKGNVISFSNISFPFLKQCIKYGFPLTIVEFANNLLILGDRYVILYFWGPENVALYSAGYNVAQYSQMLLYKPLSLALAPIYLKIWEEQGRIATEDFLRTTLRYYVMFGLPIVFALSYFGKDLLILLATSRYQSAYIIIPYVCLSYFMFGLYVILTASMYISKNTKILTFSLSSAAAFNMILNIILVPYLGIQGAAIATLIAYILLVIIVAQKSVMLFNIKLNPITIVKSIILSSAMVFIMNLYSNESSVINLGVKIILGCVFYLICILFIDSEFRNIALKIKNRMLISLGSNKL